MRGLSLLMLMAVMWAQEPGGANGAASAKVEPPAAPKKPVEEVLHGHKIVDPYRWLENAQAAETQRFVEQQMAYTQKLLGQVPGRDKIKQRLTELLSIGTIGVPQYGGESYFHTRRKGLENNPVLYVRKGVEGADRELVNVNKLAADGTTALEWWYPSEDGKLLAYGISESGSEVATLQVLEVETGKHLADKFQTGRGTSLEWLPDASGFYYSRFPKKGEVPAGEEAYHRKIFFHKLGSDFGRDEMVWGEGRHPQEWPNASLSPDGRWLLIDASLGWTKTNIFLKDRKDANGKFVQITQDKEFLYSAEIFGDNLYIATNEGAPRFRVFKTSLAKPTRENWKELIPEADAVLQDMQLIAGQLVINYQKNVSSRLKVFSLDGKQVADVQLPGIGAAEGVSGRAEGREAFYMFESFTTPPTVFRREMGGGKVSEWAHLDAPVNPANYDVEQVWYASKDGTKIPMFIVARKGLKKDGNNPTILYGYGGFNVSLTPEFTSHLYLWLENGGVYAVANLRGGSEFGEDWHRAGMLERKQNVFDDYIAAAEFLIKEKYTRRERLAAHGRSNGGLLAGAALTQRPDLFGAVLSGVPLLDMLRYQNFQIAKLWIPEYGDPADPKQFEFLLKYSPYHNVKPGTKYPATLFYASDTDTRVDPMHAKKMVALMQEANASDEPILLRIETKAGHGAGGSKPVTKLIEEWTDLYSFLFWQLGVVPR